MYLSKINLLNYKNIDDLELQFNSNLNCIVGHNGRGKTNLLDAIYHLCLTKSYFNPVAVQNIQHGTDFFMLEGLFEKDQQQYTIHCSLKKGQKKNLRNNGKNYTKFSEHIGKFPVVMISPADRDLIVEGSETRRKFMDAVIAQQDLAYLKCLQDYNQVLIQRNALLKYFALNRTFDQESLEVYNEQLIIYGVKIHNKRKKFVDDFLPIFIKRHQSIVQEKEAVNLVYSSKLNEATFDNLLRENITKDKVLQYTSVGVHKDDFLFLKDDYSIKKFGSQGQQKSYLIALKLAQFDFVKQNTSTKPILLLDDIFDKLDSNRVSHLVKLVSGTEFGQIFITDTHAERINSLLSELKEDFQIIDL